MNQEAVNRINNNDGLRYVPVPGGGRWPLPRELYDLLPAELR